MSKRLIQLILIMGISTNGISSAEQISKTDWLRDARIGAFMHFLPDPVNGPSAVTAFDVNALAEQLSSMDARYFVFTLGQIPVGSTPLTMFTTKLLASSPVNVVQSGTCLLICMKR